MDPSNSFTAWPPQSQSSATGFNPTTPTPGSSASPIASASSVPNLMAAAGTPQTPKPYAGAKRGRKPYPHQSFRDLTSVGRPTAVPGMIIKQDYVNAGASAGAASPGPGPSTPAQWSQSSAGWNSGVPQTPTGGSSTGGGVVNHVGSLSLPGAPSTSVPTASASTSAVQGMSTTSAHTGTGTMGPPPPRPAPEDDGEGDDEVLPAMAEDDYSAQLSWQSQSKDNLKVLMDNMQDSPEQYERFEAYRRHALPKQAVRKVIQQTLGQQVSQPVAQIVAGLTKVFVGEIVEKARKVQERQGDAGPLTPDHLRQAYRAYQEETGRVGAARPLRAKRLFMR